MNQCKLQLGCLVIVLFVVLIYYRQYFRYQLKYRFSLFDLLIITAVFSLVMDGVTAYTVNHLDTISHSFNLALHTLFLISLDTVVFVLFLYVLTATYSFPKKRITKIMILLPFSLNIVVVLFGIRSLKFIEGSISNYSMGLSAYTCFVMVGIYTLLTCIVFLKRWNYIGKSKKASIMIYLFIQISATLYQVFLPQALVTSIATTALILGIYLTQEDPAMRELSGYHHEMVMGFATLIENRDESTGEHIRRTAAYVRLLAEELNNQGCYTEILTKEYLDNLLMAAPLHDIGKIAVPDAILQKPGRLTEEEFNQIKKHTVCGGQIIRETFHKTGNADYLEIAYKVARFHHEKWNGTGYPDGLRKTEIPLCARIMAIADVFDAVSENRCYRAAMSLDECFGIIEKGSGTDFEPQLVKVFLGLRTKIEQAHDRNKQDEEEAIG